MQAIERLNQRLSQLETLPLKEQILALNEISYELKEFDAARTKTLVLRALTLVENVLGLEGLQKEQHPVLSQKEATAQKADLLCTLSYCLWRLSEHNEAILRAEESAKLYTELGNNSGRASALLNLGSAYFNLANYAKALEYYQQSERLYADAKDRKGQANALSNIGNVYWRFANYPKALQHYQESFLIREELGDVRGQAISMNNLGNVYHILKDYERALACREKSVMLWRALQNKRGEATSLVNTGTVYEAQGQYERALELFHQACEIYEKLGDRYGRSETRKSIASMYMQLNQLETAIELYKQSLSETVELGNVVGQVEGLMGLSDALLRLNRAAEAKEALLRAKSLAEQAGLKREEYEVWESIARYHAAQGEYQQAFEAYQKFHQLKETLLNEEQRKHLSNLQAFFDVESARKEAEIERLRSVELANALAELKATQEQLVQREKLAALGELAAKVAHEIQNPLNFVNNFAQLSMDMIDEVLTAIPVAGAERETLAEVFNTLRRNAEKVLWHGTRAAQIVKAMLEHSRLSSGERTPTDINKLLRDSLTCAVESFRHQEKNFELGTVWQLAEHLPLLPVASQDMFRAFLNIMQNGIHSAWKKATEHGGPELPKLTITTSREDKYVRISIRDNGMGIPKNIQDKIFQPFFTTKLHGEGTGLGLAITSDVIKAHGGTIELRSQEHEFAEFIICLPLESLGRVEK